MPSIRNRHFLLFDLIAISLSAYLAFVFRLEQVYLGAYRDDWLLFTLLALFITIPAFITSRLYTHYWRYASARELLVLVGTTSAATIVVAALALAANHWLVGFSIPRTMPFIYLPVVVCLVTAPRAMVRLYDQFRRRGRHAEAKPVLIVGAGDAGATIMREIRNSRTARLDVLGFVDDDPKKQHARIHGVPVRGTRADIPRLVREFRIKEVIIAMPTVPGTVIREIVQLCEKADVVPRTMPGIDQLIDGSVSVNLLRKVEIEDLLRREPVRIDARDIRSLLAGKRILVTGAGGSIGSELCRQIAQCQPEQLLLVGHGENSIFTVINELHRLFPDIAIEYRIADVRNRSRLDAIFERFRPQVVFHAAAHKHVALMEANPSEAITNNVLGTKNVVELAAAQGVSHFVLISTDKAVNPTNVMGASKRCAELIVRHAARRVAQPYVAVRFGNVLGSNGSVVPLFKQQISSGGPVTVTHPDMERFFMTIPEAVQLVLQAATLGEGQEVFVLDMGKPIRIQDMARDLIELSGLQPGEDIEVVFTGTRPGEKLYEELFTPDEKYGPTKHEKVFVAQNATHTEVSLDTLRLIDELIEEARSSNDAAIRPLLQRIVLEYTPAEVLPPPATLPAPTQMPPPTINGFRPRPSNGHLLPH